MSEEATYDLNLLRQSLAKWEKSPAVRAFYRDLFDCLVKHSSGGPALDLGSGIGTIKNFYPDIVTSDIVKTPYVDSAVSCYELEATGRKWETLLATDVLHHLRRPFDFFRSAARVLNPGGRIVLCEPAATAFGLIFYRLFHHEPIRPAELAPPFNLANKIGANEDEEFANMGMAVSIFLNHRQWTEAALAEMGFNLVSLEYRDFLSYPLTGGLSKPQLIPAELLKILMKLEQITPQLVMKFFALRMIIVLQKQSDDPA